MAHPRLLSAFLARALRRRSRAAAATPREDTSKLHRAPFVIRAVEALLVFVAMSLYVAALVVGGYVVMHAVMGG